MNEFLAVFASENLLLLAHRDDPKSAALIRNVATATKHQVYEFGDVRGFLDNMRAHEHIVVPVFDHLTNGATIQRCFRFVNRSGHAHFPQWVPAHLERAVLVYRFHEGFAREIQANFAAWASMTPRSRNRAKGRQPKPGLHQWDQQQNYFC